MRRQRSKRLAIAKTDVFQCSFPSWRIERTDSRALRRLVYLVTRARVPRPQWVGYLLFSARVFFRGREEKKLAHLAGDIPDRGSLLFPCKGLLQNGGVPYPESPHL